MASTCLADGLGDAFQCLIQYKSGAGEVEPCEPGTCTAEYVALV